MKYLLVAAGVLAASVGLPLAEQAPPAACRAAAPAVSREPNIFTPAQESDLGDAVAERYEPFIGVIEDPDLTAPLQRIGDRLIRHLPPTALRITFRLMDIPDANAFVLPGGRIYVSRKLIGFTRTEDELAGVLGHELGHLIARQQTIEMTRRFKEVIGVTEVGDRRDIFEKFNRLTDNAARKPGAFRSDSREDGDQIEADRIGLFAVAAAGYDPQAHVKLFDRISGTEGRTGSFLSKMLGSTNPDARRLGEMMKNLATVPAGCAEPRTQADVAAYQDWQASVLSFSGLGRTESVHGLLAKTRLTPALRGEVTHLRFSPDGRFAIVAPTALPRSSIIVSDEPLSGETNYRTEFVAVLSNQPQGGFITRRPTPAVDVADSSTGGGEGFGFFFQPGWNSQPQTSNARRRGGQPYYPAQRGYPAQQGYPVQQGYPMQPGRW